MTFAERLAAAQETFGPVCVGADPHASILQAWGLPDNPAGLARFAEIFAGAFAGSVASIKPQVAFFERHGSAGLAVLENLIGTFRDAGTLVVADAKRGDIGSTMEGYAQAWLGQGPLGSDAVTLSPYLGVGALAPAFERAAENNRGVFVLAVTSNPDGASIQGAGTPPVAQRIIDELAEWNERLWPGRAGSIGVVIGATAGPRLTEWGIALDHLHGPILAPGVGAQGATRAQAEALAAGNPLIIPVSRAVLRSGPDMSSLKDSHLTF
ncbi:orotidine-5'-phosphate decarboxylase [Flaviflexus huanghaiensis]|uniref:orotidine-5'-phosphate decarboxylase n=1 Tax=Flaviflexus huanghaiensis TaxID=1111473 RepID=UPI0015FB53AF|nr:orotidine-5'-phosphate decarboxylase [Flaviflexus huanghaiensis]